MTKGGKLSNIEKYCIQGMFQNGVTIEQMSTELNRKEETITAYLDSIESSLQKIEENKTPKAKDFMITKTSGGKKGVAIMTQTASEHGDASRQNPSVRQNKLRDAIHRIYPDEA
jgi:hypothetical protein